MGRTKSGNLALASYGRVLTDYCDNIENLLPAIYTYDKVTDEVDIKYYNYDLTKISEDLEINKTEIKNLLQNSVKARLMSDRPLGCLLSGGLDSSLVCSIMCQLVGSKNVKTFSIGMKNSIDLKYAKKVAEFLNTDHTEIVFTPEEGLQAIPDVIKDLETYDITTVRASIPMWLLSKYISENTDIKVLLSGEGSDELFCGYLYFHYAPTKKELQEESLRLLKNLYKYDVLRADRCVSSHGLELRVPFLDKNLIDYVISLKPSLKEPIDGTEKYILRHSFDDQKSLPLEVLWRTKDGLSDGVSSKDKNWYQYIEEYSKYKVKQNHNFPSNSLISSKFQHNHLMFFQRILFC